MSVNKVILVGSLGRDPEMKYMPNGDAICNFSVATSERFKKDGQPQERTEWHRCVVYRKLAEVCGQYLAKGSQVYVEGKIQSREWQDKEGAKRTTTEIIVNEMKMLGGKKQEKPAQAESPRAKAMQGVQDIADDLPFANPYKGRLSYVV